MKAFTHALEGKALDYAVAIAEGFTRYPGDSAECGTVWHMDPSRTPFGPVMNVVNYTPSVSSQGDNIIDRERICTVIGHDGVWLAYIAQNYSDEPEFMCAGTTRREAAMRTHVLRRLGKKVELP